ncbi:MAG: hypothetical protein K2J73_12500 [Oscillospiraceae bacterium]|nr:hypothetical protein [Oscillospiraceae bacterium]
MLSKSNKKFLLGAILSMAVCFSACSDGNEENGGTNVTETASETSAETSSVTASESVSADEPEMSEDNGAEEDDLTEPLTADPESAVKVYLQKLSESENVTSAELKETRIGERYSLAYKYYESPLAEEFAVDGDTLLVPVNVDYYVEYTEASGLESGEKSEYFLVKCGENGFEVIDTFPYDPKEYYGVVTETLTNGGDGASDFYDYYMVELDGGLGTVRCNNAITYIEQQKSVGERVKIYGNGDIYGDPPRIDALFVGSEDGTSDEE